MRLNPVCSILEIIAIITFAVCSITLVSLAHKNIGAVEEGITKIVDNWDNPIVMDAKIVHNGEPCPTDYTWDFYYYKWHGINKYCLETRTRTVYRNRRRETETYCVRYNPAVPSDVFTYWKDKSRVCL